MAIGFITGIIIALMAVAAIIFTAYQNIENENVPASVIGGIVSAVLILVFIIVPFSFHTVDTGEVAVVKHLGEAKKVQTPGTYFELWMTNKYVTYDGKVQNTPIETAAYSSDAQTMTLQMSLQYQIRTENVMDIANKYGTLSALNDRIVAIATEKTKSVLSGYKAMDIISDRSAMSPAVEEAIKNAVGEEYYVDIVAVTLTNIDFSDAFEQAVEDKMIAEQTKLKSEYEAEAKLVAAEAEAKANELLERSLTDRILQEMYLDKWNGKLPQVVTDGNMIFQIPDMTEKK